VFAMALSVVMVSFGHAFAVNLLQNPHFNGDLSGWNAGTSTYDAALDATGVSGSGSAQSVFNATQPSTLLSIDQCLTNFVPGQSYYFGGKVYMPSGQSVQGTGAVVVSWFTGNDCATGFISYAQVGTSFGDPTGIWTPLDHAQVTIPANAASVWVSGQNGIAASGTHQTNFDDMYFSDTPPTPPAPVPAMDEWGMMLFVVLAASGSVYYLRKQRRAKS
ncbi:MAG: hypothetical protein M0Z60_01095, partial [Nitrospiraceae bacterium]|nr:hypothetical protein [Nitrospiraceae bacterium]